MELKITDLPKLINKLPKKDKELFNRFYSFEISDSKLSIPTKMETWIKNKFGSLEKVKNQKVVLINNNFTKEGSLFNELRNLRPIQKVEMDLKKIEKKENCNFCNPKNFTPYNVFGRIKGKYCITAVNVAKYDYFHGLVIFREHNPLKIKKVWLHDYFKTADKWFEKVRKTDMEAKNFFLIWNCLWRAGASIVHGHMQLCASKMQYGKLDLLAKISDEYKKKFDSDYFSDLFEIHKSLGLGLEIKKSKLVFYLTPIKEKEIVIFSKEKKFEKLSDLVYRVLQNYFRLDVKSFNLSLYKIKDYWILHLVDRGPIDRKNSDIGAMELYGNSVISSDPFKLAKEFRL